MDASFDEKQFARLAENHVMGRLPDLNRYYQGFKLIDKSDDDRRAVGVAMYRMDSTSALVPIIFYEGKLRGSDILILKDVDLYAPSIPKWLDAVKGQAVDAREMGSILTGRRSGPRGTATKYITLDENLLLSKSASAKLPTVTEWARMLLKAAADEGAPFDLCKMLPKLSKEASDRFAKTFSNNPDYANAILRFYQCGTLSDTMQSIQKKAEADLEAKQSADSPPAVTIIDGMNHPEAPLLDKEEKRLLANNGFFVKDLRPDTSKLYDARMKFPEHLRTVSAPGLYMVLRRNGQFSPAAVFWHQESDNRVCSVDDRLTEGHTGKYRETKIEGRRMLVLGLSNELFATERSNKIWIRDMTAAERATMQGKTIGEAFNLPRLKAMLEDRGQDKIIILAPDGSAVTLDRWSATNLLQVDGSGFVYTSGTLGIPAKARLLAFKRPQGQADAPCSTELLERASTWELGSPDNLVRVVRREAGVSELNITRGDHSGLYQIRSEKGLFPHLTTKEAAEHLALREGIAGPQVSELLKGAARRLETKVLIKYAAGFQGNDPAQTMSVQTMNAQSTNTAVNPDMVGDAQVGGVVQAAEQGNRDLMDLKVIEGLVRASDPAELRKNFLPDIIRGMDKLGRLLFTLYWRQDHFEERYGDNFEQLASKTKDAFQAAGDVALYLKEKMMLSADSDEHQLELLSRNLGTLEQPAT